MRSTALVLMLVAGCGAQPNQPVLANVPKPNTAAMAGGAAAAAAAITLASPDAANPERHKQEKEKKPITVKEHVPAGVLDRADRGSAAATDDKQPQPAGSPKTEPRPRDGLDFGGPR
jgi:hypothetical protein